MPKKKTNVSRKKVREFQILKINSGTLSFPSILYFYNKQKELSTYSLPLHTILIIDLALIYHWFDKFVIFQ